MRRLLLSLTPRRLLLWLTPLLALAAPAGAGAAGVPRLTSQVIQTGDLVTVQLAFHATAATACLLALPAGSSLPHLRPTSLRETLTVSSADRTLTPKLAVAPGLVALFLGAPERTLALTFNLAQLHWSPAAAALMARHRLTRARMAVACLDLQPGRLLATRFSVRVPANRR